MRAFAVYLVLGALPLLGGCSLLPGALFGVFGDGYSGGGYTRADREADFNRRVEASQQHYSPD
jgi:hypothetical protein